MTSLLAWNACSDKKPYLSQPVEHLALSPCGSYAGVIQSLPKLLGAVKGDKPIVRMQQSSSTLSIHSSE